MRIDLLCTAGSIIVILVSITHRREGTFRLNALRLMCTEL